MGGGRLRQLPRPEDRRQRGDEHAGEQEGVQEVCGGERGAFGRDRLDASAWWRFCLLALSLFNPLPYAPVKLCPTKTSRVSSVDASQPARPGDTGYKYVIRLKASGSLAMAIAHRPNRVGGCSFQLPLTLATSLPAAAWQLPPGVAAAAARGPALGQTAGTEGGVTSDPLSVPVTATGVQPLVVLSKNAVDFGACVVARGGGGGGRRVSPYSTDIYVRNNTEDDIEVGSFESCGFGRVVAGVRVPN